MKFEDLKDLPHLQGIYKFTNLENYKECVGKGDDLWIRLNKGYPSEINGSETNRPIVNALRYYGWDKFNVEILYIPEEKIDNNILLFLETSCICEYKTHVSEGGYNVCRYSNDHTGRKLTEEHKKKISESETGRIFSKEQIEKMIKNHKGMKGQKHSEETKQKMRDRSPKLMLGKKLPEETKLKISKNHPFKKKIKQIDIKTNEVIKIWDSIIDAVKSLPVKTKNIYSLKNAIIKVCKGRKENAYNFKWEYV